MNPPDRIAVTLTGPIRRAGLWLAIAVMVLAGMVAPGTMPQRAADGWQMVICTGQGPVAIMVGADGQPLSDRPTTPPDNPTDQTPCAFAAAVAPVLLPAAVALPLPDGRAFAAPASRHTALATLPATPRAFAARAPPARIASRTL